MVTSEDLFKFIVGHSKPREVVHDGELILREGWIEGDELADCLQHVANLAATEAHNAATVKGAEEQLVFQREMLKAQQGVQFPSPSGGPVGLVQ